MNSAIQHSVNQLVSQSIVMVHLIHISLELVLMRNFFFFDIELRLLSFKNTPIHTHRRALTHTDALTHRCVWNMARLAAK